jgi:hypothetical protein
MYQNDKTITPEEQAVIDDYLFPQLLAKNGKMIRMYSGIRITDRAYLDLFAFSKSDAVEIKRKAIELKKRTKAWGKPLESGHIFFLRASRESLKQRLARRGTKKAGRGKVRFDSTTLVKQEKELLEIYKISLGSIIDTTNSSASETARIIARTILLEKYEAFDFTARLDEVIEKGGKF